MFDFRDQVVIITGASGNLGHAVAHGFQDAGARLALFDLSAERIRERCADLGAGDGSDGTLFVGADLTDAESVADAVGRSQAVYGRVDVLANIAGGFRGGTPLAETSLETWESMMRLNARSVFLMCRAVIPLMTARDSGRIVNVAARAALTGQAGLGAYTASKSAVIRLTESLAEEVKGQGINVNCVLPGTLDTPANRQASPEANFDHWVAPAALADVVMFLASAAARAIHGAAVPVYGLS